MGRSYAPVIRAVKRNGVTMDMTPNIDRLKKLKLSKMGDTIVFCPDCFWQDINVGMKPICPECGERLHFTHVDQDLIDLKGWQ